MQIPTQLLSSLAAVAVLTPFAATQQKADQPTGLKSLAADRQPGHPRFGEASPCQACTSGRKGSTH